MPAGYWKRQIRGVEEDPFRYSGASRVHLVLITALPDQPELDQRLIEAQAIHSG
jgi:hypothetical protein